MEVLQGGKLTISTRFTMTEKMLGTKVEQASLHRAASKNLTVYLHGTPLGK